MWRWHQEEVGGFGNDDEAVAGPASVQELVTLNDRDVDYEELKK